MGPSRSKAKAKQDRLPSGQRGLLKSVVGIDDSLFHCVFLQAPFHGDL
ncbi:hypothetical protein PAMC26510_22635 [Caballeronia sordidicola]|uniref:Uncharacterized protein n=1 Tax=Caballeronia sordidicola TaxID=196367 RepID=A0A242MKY4_CABSO|nr:hypothetical protein PAMC26510_22635 [Caballeronia sordidicola]